MIKTQHDVIIREPVSIYCKTIVFSGVVIEKFAVVQNADVNCYMEKLREQENYRLTESRLRCEGCYLVFSAFRNVDSGTLLLCK